MTQSPPNHRTTCTGSTFGHTFPSMNPLNEGAGSTTDATRTIRILRLIDASRLSESQSNGAATVSKYTQTTTLRLYGGWLN
ncbi:hypothetical protein RESH_01274 [Rhodopirellula europaea SH398]|uniref:Uncharacterized protein n=1 Tax=Rhodopirellula europaea SH398 TaxID=1263868 RepID=M5S954_9BACT|nr:hypothetical protein RESH_01274 [Rhodopirellula europaea SH398]